MNLAPWTSRKDGGLMISFGAVWLQKTREGDSVSWAILCSVSISDWQSTRFHPFAEELSLKEIAFSLHELRWGTLPGLMHCLGGMSNLWVSMAVLWWAWCYNQCRSGILDLNLRILAILDHFSFILLRTNAFNQHYWTDFEPCPKKIHVWCLKFWNFVLIFEIISQVY